MAKFYIVSGGFDPIHEGHIDNIIESRENSDGVIVLLNSDEWLIRKKKYNFLNLKTRQSIMQNIKGVIDVIIFDDSDNSACKGLIEARLKYPNDELFFAKGGDRNQNNIPEIEICQKFNIAIKYDVGFQVSGKHKPNSSSWILNKWIEKIAQENNIQNFGERPWGKFIILQDSEFHKVKKVTVNSGHRLSLQLHEKRCEHWFILKGLALVTLNAKNIILTEGQSIDIKQGDIHRIANYGKEDLIFIEIQTGEYFGEDDIKRIEDDYARK